MIFTRMAQVVAMLALVFGALYVLMGVTYLSVDLKPDPAWASVRQLPPGHAILGGLFMGLIGVALGTLTEISLSVRRGSEGEGQ
jgi:hypothetical protein